MKGKYQGALDDIAEIKLGNRLVKECKKNSIRRLQYLIYLVEAVCNKYSIRDSKGKVQCYKCPFDNAFFRECKLWRKE